jgi:hypothetical protein
VVRITRPGHPVISDIEQFDYCDPQNTFATLVVQQAVKSPTLLYAILATSARHLSMISDFDAYLADKYHRECLELLIHIVGDSSALLDDALCAATVILRLFEEISGKVELNECWKCKTY